MKFSTIQLITAFALAFCGFQSQAQYNFQVKKNIDCTEVKSQGRTGTCWSFATSSFLESEAMRSGKEAVDLS